MKKLIYFPLAFVMWGCAGQKETIDADKLSMWQKELACGKIDSASYKQLVQNERAVIKMKGEQVKRASDGSCDKSPTGYHEWQLCFTVGCCSAVYQCYDCKTYKNINY